MVTLRTFYDDFLYSFYDVFYDVFSFYDDFFWYIFLNDVLNEV